MIELVTISPMEVLATVIATIAMYLVMVVLIRVLGRRPSHQLSSFDVAAVIAFGAIIGRSALDMASTTGVVALCTLVLIQAIVSATQATPLGSRVVAVKPVLLMAGSQRLEANLRRCHIWESRTSAQAPGRNTPSGPGHLRAFRRRQCDPLGWSAFRRAPHRRRGSTKELRRS